MPRPLNTSRVSLIGHLGTSEIFDVSFWLDGAPADQATANTWAAHVATALGNALVTPLKTFMDSTDGIDQVKVYGYPNATGPASVIGQAAVTGWAGSAASGSRLFQFATCCTLVTGLAGRQHRGRMYWPTRGILVAATGLSPNSACDTIAHSVGNLLGLVGADAVINHNPVVVSVAGSAATVIQSVRVDNRPDIQRRRANQLKPTYAGTHPVDTA